MDDDFFIDVRRAMGILAGLRTQGLSTVLQGVDLHTIARLSDDELGFLEQAGVERISIGVESGVDHIRAGTLGKWGSITAVRQQLHRLAGRRFLVLCSFMIGLPGETRADMRETIDLASWCLALGQNLRVQQLYNYHPYPGTALARLLEMQGFRFPATLDEWGNWDFDRNVTLRDDATLKEFVERAVFLSKFLDRKMDDYGVRRLLLRAAYNLYRPVAKFRLRSELMAPLPERRVYDLLKGLLA